MPTPPSRSAISRRALLAGGAGLLAGGALPVQAQALGDQPRQDLSRPARPARPQARNIIFMVSDGASMGTLSLAEQASQLRRGRSTWWTRLWTEPGARRAMMGTSALESLVTDSAAASSAWGIGRKVRNGSVNVLPDQSTPTPILVSAKAAGMRTGLVTTTRLTDATPAGFIANVPRRTLEAMVAGQMLERGVDLLLGGGGRYFDPQMLSTAKATMLHSADELASAPGLSAQGPLVGLFAKGKMSYEIDRSDTQPSLAAMTRAALDRLDAATADSEHGFLIQIEGARVDHAAHANDAAALVGDQLAFDDAVGAAMEFVAHRGGRDGDTLLIVTTDHGNANPGLTVYGRAGEEGLQRLLEVRHSFEWMLRKLAKGAAAVVDAVDLTDDADADAAAGVLLRSDDLSKVVHEGTGVELKPEEIAWVRRRLVERQPVNGFGEADSLESALGAVLANHFGVAFISVNHTSDLVDCTAWGPGSERLPPVIENTELYGLMLGALGLRPRK